MNVKEIAVKTGTKLTSKLGRVGLKIQKHSPEILVVAGTVSVVTGVVLCCKATLHAEEVLDKHEEEIETIDAARDLDKDYSESDARKDMAIVYAHTVGGFVKLYAPGVGFTLLGIGCFLGSYGVLKKRNVALMAAYKALEVSFGDYRKRVREKFGDDTDYYLKYGFEKTPEDAVVEDGDEVQQKMPTLPNGLQPSVYARFFDETSTEWTRSNETNRMILHARQNWANDLLNAQGHLFLNDVYKMLGMEPSQAGQVVGWVKNNPRGGDNYVDFGIFNINRPKSRDFVNGLERSILLDFNVDGVIWDLI